MAKANFQLTLAAPLYSIKKVNFSLILNSNNNPNEKTNLFIAFVHQD